jgi:proteic killer suppression protein
VKTINKLKSVTRVEQLFQINSLRYEKKQGNLKGVSAVRINDQYRLLFHEVASDSETLVIDLFEIEDISKHYE